MVCVFGLIGFVFVTLLFPADFGFVILCFAFSLGFGLLTGCSF